MTPAVTWLLEATPDKPVLISIWEGRVYVKPNVFTEATWVGLGRRESHLVRSPLERRHDGQRTRVPKGERGLGSQETF